MPPATSTPQEQGAPPTADPAVATDTADQRSGASIFLVDSRWRISELTRLSCGFTASAEGFGPGRMRWGGVASGKYTLSAKRADKILWQEAVVVDDTQRLTATVASDALTPLSLQLTCTLAN